MGGPKYVITITTSVNETRFRALQIDNRVDLIRKILVNKKTLFLGGEWWLKNSFGLINLVDQLGFLSNQNWIENY